MDYSNDGYEYLWGVDDLRASAGSRAAWPAAGGANALDPATSPYPRNMNSMMVYGPFDLTDASDAKATFKTWLQIEDGFDNLFFAVSSDGQHFNGYEYTGTSGWQTREVNFKGYIGNPSVWVAWGFQSDDTIQLAGPWVDEIKVEKYRDCSNGFASGVLTSAQLFSAYQAAHDAAPVETVVEDPYAIALQSRLFTPEPGFDPSVLGATNLSAANSPDMGNKLHALVQLYEIPSPEQRAELAAQGLELQSYLSSRAWVAAINRGRLADLATNPQIRWLGPLTPADRTSTLLQEPAVAALITDSPDKTMPLIVEFAPDVDVAAGQAIVGRYGGQVQSVVQSINALLITLPAGMLSQLSAEDGVTWIEPPLPKFDPLNDCVRERVGANALQTAPYNLNGSGVDLLVYDDGTVAATHSAFTGRLTVGDSSGTKDHPTHMAGTAAGTGAGSPLGRDLKGIAPAANVISFGLQNLGSGSLYNDPGDIEADWRTAKTTYGADLGTASIGTSVASNGLPCDWEGNYGAVGQLLDAIVRGSLGEPYIATWAAGNERSTGRCGTGYGTIPPPSNAKNPIHVGATYSDSDLMTPFSSWGPSDDGRIQPTISAPGCEVRAEGSIYSSVPSNDYTFDGWNGTDHYSWCGTSIATAAVAGAASLMIQQFRTSYNTSGEPLPSTIKALLIHTAVDKGNAGPDYQYGYGRVDAVKALDAIVAGDAREESIEVTNDYHEYTYSSSSITAELRVSLAWDDAASNPAALSQLVNDLDLTVISPFNQTFQPFILNSASPGNAATTGADHLNNQEQVIVPNAAAGTWTIRVRANALPVGPQAYSIVFHGARNASKSVNRSCYTLTKAVGAGGSGVVNANPAPNCEGGTKYTWGTVVQLTAVANPDNGFVNWTGDATGSANPTSVTMTANRAVTANFSNVCFTLTKTIGAGGSGVVNAEPDSQLSRRDKVHLGDGRAADGGGESGQRLCQLDGGCDGLGQPDQRDHDCSPLGDGQLQQRLLRADEDHRCRRQRCSQRRPDS